MLLAAQMRRISSDSAWTDAPGSGERYLHALWERQAATGSPPANWRGWTSDFWTIRKALHGGGAPPDTGFFARARAYVEKAGGPPPARAAVALGEALAQRHLAEGAGPVDLLVLEARAGRIWIPRRRPARCRGRTQLAAGRPGPGPRGIRSAASQLDPRRGRPPSRAA